MIPLIAVPDFVHDYASKFEDLFSPALMEHFERYLAGLYVCERRNAQTINNTFVIRIKDQSSLNRFLTQYRWSTQELNERRIKLLKDNPVTTPKKSGILIIDDTYNEKFGKHFQEVAMLYMPNKGYRHLAHDVITLHYADSVCDYPLELGLYRQLDIDQAIKDLSEHGVEIDREALAGKKTNGKRRSYLEDRIKKIPELADKYPNKIRLACRLVDWAVANGWTQPFVFDSWYTCKPICEHIQQQGRDWIGTMDRNDKIYWASRKDRLDEWIASRPNEEFREVEFKYRGEMEIHHAGTWTCRVGNLGKVRLVASYRQTDRGDDPKLIVTNRLDWEMKHILQSRRRRWTVETGYEDVKGPLGFDEYEVRDIAAIIKHWYLVLAAYSASKHATAQGRTGKWLQNRLLTVGDVCREVQREALAGLILFCITQVTQEEDVEQLLNKVLGRLAAS